MTQKPEPESFLLKWRGDTLTVTLDVGAPRKGRAAFRTNIGHAGVRRREIIDETERGVVPLAKAWADIPLDEVGPGVYRADIPLDEVGVFSGKACFFPEGSSVPEWPEGRNLHVKVESAETRSNNSVYCVFPRQFGSFREIVRRLPHIMDDMGFRIIQTLPPFPVPTTYAVMGEYGCPFAATDFLSVDPAMAEFDEAATPLDQFRELIGAVHAKRGLIFIDLPANHTGWASTLQTHHPEWFRREADGRFHSPGAWGVTWADLVELDYARPGLREYMAGVFLFWCRLGVDGFRCDAGYMIAAETWEYIVSRVREEYPDTVFLLEGLGGKLSVTDRLLSESNLDWAYSEIFQTYDRGQFEWYLPQAIERAEKYGALIHFAETHDNDRLAKGGETYARLRVQLAALLSWQGAWGMANGVEWYCTEKIDVHGRNGLNWGAERNMVGLIAKLNLILRTHPGFSGPAHLSVVTRGEGNTLAVLRRSDGGDLLTLANLDCGGGATIDWDRSQFPLPEAFDLISERVVALSAPVALGPGEVLCLSPRSTFARQEAPTPAAAACGRVPLFRLEFPRDATREVVVPEGQHVEVSSDVDVRVRLVDPSDGRTLRVRRSMPDTHRVVFSAPSYRGGGTRCRSLRLEVTRYDGGRAVRTISTFLVPPPARRARASLALSGAEVRQHPEWRSVLSNGAGAAAQVRAGWGVIRSQYDAMLAANPNPTCPSDRLSLWARTRCWLQREGYVREFDARCSTRFLADPAGRFAHWHFTVPCGMGREASFVVTLSLARGENAAALSMSRVESGVRDVGDQVRVVFRPDIEWRSFHSVTKAYADGTEARFSAAAMPVGAEGAEGFDFAPYGEDVFSMRVAGGAYHHEPQWTYSVGHPEEAERGQDGSGDLFSPGWISADLKVGETVTLTGALNAAAKASEMRVEVPPERPPVLSLGQALREALGLFVVRRDDLKTVIAGYPWFLDWGRDTFIFMRGMIAAGMTDDALRILQAFAAFEENGTLPNIIYGKTAGNRDTTDAPLWFIRCVQELSASAAAKASPEFAAAVAALVPTCESIVDNYVKGTPNGIRVDAESGLVWSPSHFTWMDTNYPACTPRVGYPVEIQALWISALRFLGRGDLAARALESVKRLFKREGGGYCDCLDAPNGEPAAKARADASVRPNQLFLLSLGVLNDASILDATERLLVPGGVRTLDSGNLLYRGVYAGDEDTSRKPAYHNGTAWAWPFPLYAEALVALRRCTREVALSLLAGAVENLNAGCICHVSEIADGDAPHAQKGCCAQAWSESELLRVWLKLGGR
ncbi:MAG: glycogen debranching enzyme N-terminal domain-containing protein [Kiritimatiellae bacterium]|nr:glycogen debranching enzyme N-terminal domain-containing protein [Kiritimatiellia bacterium]